MPAPGDQHQRVANPFKQPPPVMAFDMQQQQQQQEQEQQPPPVQRVSEYTAQEVATLQSRLEKQLGPEYLSSRAGPSGQKVHYVAAEKVIGLANEVFGFNGWSSSIQTIQIDFVDEHPHTLKISVGLSVIVRVTLRDGTYHEDIGYGHIENCKGKAAAFEKAKKEGTTDALKRALRNFGNVLGNCIYDKAYVDRVTKIKPVPVNRRGGAFNEQALHRHADYAVKTEPGAEEAARGGGGGGGAAAAAATSAPAAPAPPAAASPAKTERPAGSAESAFVMDMFDEDLLGDFDEADFCVSDEGHPDEIVVGNSRAPTPALPPPPPQQNQAGSRNTSPVRQMPPHQNNGNRNGNGSLQRPGGPLRPPQTPANTNGRPNGGGHYGARPYQPANNQPYGRPPQPSAAAASAAAAQRQPHGNGNGNGSSSHNHSSRPDGGKEPDGTPWLSARAVAKVAVAVGDDGGDALGAVAPAVQAGHLFNPKAESPSIRKTPGVDHTSSKPVPRLNGGRPAGATAPTTAHTNGSSSTPAAAVAAAAAAAAAAHGGGAQAPTTLPPAGAAGGGPPTAVAARPMAEPVRRIGAPPSAMSPLANRGQFRPPPMKRSPPTDTPAGGAVPGAGAGAGRPPLADVSANVAANGGTGVAAEAERAAGMDAKRRKVA